MVPERSQKSSQNISHLTAVISVLPKALVCNKQAKSGKVTNIIVLHLMKLIDL